MKKHILTLFGLLTTLCLSAQVTITTSPTHDKYQIVEGSYRTEVPLGSTYVDVNSSSQVAIKTIGTDKILVNYKTPSTYTINGSNYTNLDSCVKYLALATSLQLEYLISNISGGSGSDSTIYKSDGVSNDFRTAEFTQGLSLKSDNKISIDVGNYRNITNDRGFAFSTNSDSILLVDSIFGAYYKNIRNPMLNTELVPKWYVDSVAGVAGVESVNGKDGVLSIVAGDNVTIDDSRPDTIVISSSGGGGGDYEAGFGIVINDVDSIIEVNTTEVITVNGNGPENPIVGNLYLDQNALIQIGNLSFLSKDQLILLDDAGNAMVLIGGGMGGNYHGGNGFDLTPDGLGFNHKIDHDSLDGNDVPQKWYVDSVAGGGGNYLPLNIQDSTTVNLSDNALIFQGENHSLAINDRFEALVVADAIIDGFRSTSYGDIYTLNGLIRAPLLIGDTSRFPLMFLSKGIPYVDSVFDFTSIKPFYKSRSDYGFEIMVDNDEAVSLMWLFSKNGFHFLKGEDKDIVLTIDPTTGVLTVTNEIIGDSYHPKTSPYSFAQMQDLARTIITNPANNTLVNPATKEVVVNIASDSVNIMIPDAADCDFWHLYIKNNSSTAVTVKTENDEVAFWEGGVLSDEYTAPAGTVTHILFDGENYLIK